MSVRQAHAADTVAVDHLPACPSCGDLNHRRASLCAGCSTPLTTLAAARAATAARIRATVERASFEAAA